ncbi:MAG: T9SS type A sorting domain-containing protein [Chitinophagales bacterium]|nr:T9SS type A sorting domain-containing protein [Chitinophagales bacterium]
MKQINILKKYSASLILLLLLCTTAEAQLSGTYTIGGTSPDYSTLSAAISDLNSQGVNGAVIFNIRDGNYVGSSWRGTIGNITGASASNTITFKSQSGNRGDCILSPSGSSSTNYVFYLNSAKWVTIKDLTLNNTSSSYGCDIRIAGSAANNTIQNCVIGGHTGSSTSTNKARIYGTSLAGTSNINFIDNLIDRGSMAFYLFGNGTTSLAQGYMFKGNEFNENYYYWGYGYYLGNITFEDNTFNRSGSASSYFYGLYMYYTGNGFTLKANTFNNTCKAYRNYCAYFYRSNYYTQNSAQYPMFEDNVVNMSTTSSTYYNYPWYNYYGYYGVYKNNTFNYTHSYTSGYIYDYFMYYGQKSVVEGNTWNYNKSGGTIYARLMYYGSNDTFRNNTVNMNGTYPYYYFYTPYYCSNYYFSNNTIKGNLSSSGGIYNYVYYYKGIYRDNEIDLKSNYGTIYGMYLYYQQGSKIFNNTVRVKSSGSCYGVYSYRCYKPTRFFNNTIYNEGTSSSSYGINVYHSSSSYGIQLNNNIIYKTSGNSYCLYSQYSANYFESDYNIYYKPSGSYFYASGASASSNLQSWRDKTKDDINSLIYSVPFNNAASGDFTIDASSPAAWAVNGRGIHDTSATLDKAANARPGVVTAGVPDLGAYEVTPTSTPPYATAVPANPVANKTQVFTFGEDTVATIDWGATVPSSYKVRQYTGIQASPMPIGVGRTFFYTTATTSDWDINHTPNVRYKDPWIGDVSSENNLVIARSSNGGTWEGYNYTNAATDTKLNILAPSASFDSVGAYTGVEEGRIGIRCVENPKGLTITNVTATTADLDWQPVFNPIGYQIVINESIDMPSNADWANSALALSNSHAAIGLKEDTKYFVHIRSICGPNDTSGRTIDSFITLITCHEPDVKLTELNEDRVIGYWGDVKTAFKYEYAVNTSPTMTGFGTDIYKTSQLVPYLDHNTQYYMHVRSHCSSIYPNSNWKSVAFKTWATGVTNVNGQQGGISIYPNPVVDDVNISITDLNGRGLIQVVDMTGKVLQSQTVNNTTVKLNVSELPSGIYMLQFSDDENSAQIKFNKK